MIRVSDVILVLSRNKTLDKLCCFSEPESPLVFRIKDCFAFLSVVGKVVKLGLQLSVLFQIGANRGYFGT
jgi:hypothetical protein